MTSARTLAALAPASAPRSVDVAQLVVADEDGPRLLAARAFPELLGPGDVLVVNDAATLPASMAARHARGEVEVRLASPLDDAHEANAVLFGAGDWRTRTEDRPPPPAVRLGDVLEDGALRMVVVDVSEISPRLVRLHFDGREPLAEIHRVGRPIQYAHVPAPLALWDVQNAYASRPWAVEMPSAGRILDGRALAMLAARGVNVVTLTHAAGLSDTGDPRIDARLPFPERFEVPARTREVVRTARRDGRRVVAIGTSVVRALEEAARSSEVGTVTGTAEILIGPHTELCAVTGVVTGLHEPGTSHHDLLCAFAPRARLDAALGAARAANLLGHEHGDFLFVDGSGRRRRSVRGG